MSVIALITGHQILNFFMNAGPSLSLQSNRKNITSHHMHDMKQTAECAEQLD